MKRSCSRRRRDVAAQAAVNLPGAEGFVLVEYRGTSMLNFTSRTTDAEYVFTPGTRRYVDAFDWGMLGQVTESGEQAFFEVDE